MAVVASLRSICHITSRCLPEDPRPWNMAETVEDLPLWLLCVIVHRRGTVQARCCECGSWAGDVERKTQSSILSAPSLLCFVVEKDQSCSRPHAFTKMYPESRETPDLRPSATNCWPEV